VPDSPQLSSSLGEAVEQGRQLLARLEALSGAATAEIAARQQAERQWAAERQALRDEFAARLAEAERAVASQRGRVEELEGQLAATAAETGRIREHMAVIARDRDALQADQIQWGLDREQLLGELKALKQQLAGLETALAGERDQHVALKTRHLELSEQANKAASDWAARRQALAAEIAAQNEEMEQVRQALRESQERELRLPEASPAGSRAVAAGAAALSPEQSHLINSRLNALVGFSSVLLDERSNPLPAEDRREYLKYVHDSALRLGEAVRPLTGSRFSSAEEVPLPVDKDRRPPDILVADNDHESRQRIEPFLKRAGYEVVYVDTANRALEKASSLQPLAILIDGKVPPSGAPALVRELRKDARTKEIPLVILSPADGVPLAIPDCEALSKPIDRQQLVQMMVRFDLMADGKRARKMPANVLVIDDDPQAIGLVKAILRPFNVRVSAVDGARAGIEQALRNKPDLVILDLVMPTIDGYEVIAALRRDREMSRVPILVHTAKALTAEDRQRLEGQVEAIVEKGHFQPEPFLELLLKRGERRKRSAERPAA
jgi:CheY-like chemotaxis protein